MTPHAIARAMEDCAYSISEVEQKLWGHAACKRQLRELDRRLFALADALRKTHPIRPGVLSFLRDESGP